MSHYIRIVGNPISRKSNRGKPSKSELAWQANIALQTTGFSSITTPHSVTVVFEIQKWSGIHGPDIDNLLKPLFDGLKATLLPSPTSDSILYNVDARKRRVEANPGVDLLFYPA